MPKSPIKKAGRSRTSPMMSSSSSGPSSSSSSSSGSSAVSSIHPSPSTGGVSNDSIGSCVDARAGLNANYTKLAEGDTEERELESVQEKCEMPSASTSTNIEDTIDNGRDHEWNKSRKEFHAAVEKHGKNPIETYEVMTLLAAAVARFKANALDKSDLFLVIDELIESIKPCNDNADFVWSKEMVDELYLYIEKN